MAIWRRRGWRSLLGFLVAGALVACSAAPPQEARVAGPPPAAELSAAPAAPVARPDVGEMRLSAPRGSRAESTLGTQWGEGRESVTRVVRASRLTPDRASDVGLMRYSDEDSIRRALGSQAERQTNALLADGNVELQVMNGNGIALPIYVTRGNKDFHVAGRQGERYELVYTNRSNRVYEVVATVDGLDVLSGQLGSVNSSGYLLRAGERLVIDGFRKSNREVAAFRFSSKDRAYANNTPAGEARNVGVIGTALFEVRLDDHERNKPIGRYPAKPKPQSQAFPADDGRYAPPPQYRR